MGQRSEGSLTVAAEVEAPPQPSERSMISKFLVVASVAVVAFGDHPTGPHHGAHHPGPHHPAHHPEPRYPAHRPKYDDHKEEPTQSPVYNYQYGVNDPEYDGPVFSHNENREHYNTAGEYRVNLPDGRVQIVTYSAGPDGYNADVSYEG
eukprot:maker-scaffold735_size104922-snap-gene-0.29 protein:Tk08162 transcript:maker-scaffold735_size104922-snap-gene-0.29-mRNA-1 annotation:"GL17472"